MEQIIYNLVSNAIKHTPAGGFVSFTVNEQDNKINISVADSGNGISDNLKTHLFERSTVRIKTLLKEVPV